MAVLTPPSNRTASIKVLAEVVSGNRRFVFSRPLEVQVSTSGETWRIEHVPTGLNSYGITLEEAWEDFFETVACQWDDIAQHPDDQIHPSAQRLKRQMLELIVRVEPV